jgi:hypothetical protein
LKELADRPPKELRTLSSGDRHEHLNALPYPDHLAEAQRLARKCVADAEGAGISEEELEEDLGQDLVSELRDRLGARADEEVTRLAGKGE